MTSIRRELAKGTFWTAVGRYSHYVFPAIETTRIRDQELEAVNIKEKFEYVTTPSISVPILHS